MAYLGVYGERFEEDGSSFFVYYCPKCRHQHAIPYRKSTDIATATSLDDIFEEEPRPLRQVVRINTGRSTHIDDQYENGYEAMQEMLRKDTLEFTCENCSEKHLYYRINNIRITDSPPRFFKYMSVEKDYNRIYLNVHGYYVTFFRDKAQYHEYMTRIAIHLKRFRVTVLRPLDKKGKLPPCFGEPNPMQNATYGFRRHRRTDLSFENDDNFTLDIQNQLLPALKEELPKHIKYFNEDIINISPLVRYVAKTTLSFDQEDGRKKEEQYAERMMPPYLYLERIFLGIRFHSLNRKLVDDLPKAVNSDMRKRVLPYLSYTSPVQNNDLMKKLGISKMIMKHASNFAALKSGSYWNGIITQSSNLIKILSDSDNPLNHIDSRAQRYLRLGDTPSVQVSLKEFFLLYKSIYMANLKKSGLREDKAEIQAEALVVNKVAKEKPSAYILTDLISTYVGILSAAKEGLEVPEFTIDTDKSLKYTHDLLSSVYSKIRKQNRQISHEEDVYHMQEEAGKFRFEFAPDTHTLIDIGKMMTICVGGYDQRAIDKRVNIVHVFEAENPYACCIELTGDYKVIRQAKIAYNKRPEGELLQAIVDWVKKHKLTIETTDLYNYMNEDADFEKLIHPTYLENYENHRQKMLAEPAI